jgi:cytochrome P450
MSNPQTPPRTPETPILGSFVPYAQDPPRFLHQLAQTHPTADLVHFTFLGMNNYLILNPDLVREILVNRASDFPKSQRDYVILSKFLGDGLLTAEGEQHRRQRKLAQPAFHHKRIAAYGETMVEYAEDMVAEWQAGETRDITHEMYQLTLYIVAKTLFDADKARMVDFADKVGQAMHVLQDVTNRDYRRPIQWPQWLPTADNRARQRAKAILDDTIHTIVTERRQQETADKGDLLSMLLLARDDDGQEMDNTELRDQLVTIFLAGHETTSNALSWTWYLLSQNPEAEAKLHAELDEVLDGRLPTLADLPNLPYTNMVIKEAMRLYPPAWVLTGRTAIATTTLADYTIHQGADLMISPYVLHRNPTTFPDPERFDPERFTAEREKELHRYAYIPFGAGPRVCIGNSFAMMEAQLILATVAQRFRLRLAPDQQVELNAQITLSPLDGLRMMVEEREPAAVPLSPELAFAIA